MNAVAPPLLVTDVPGPRSRALAERLARVESRNVTCLDPLPIFWERAWGANVWDVDGNRYVDLTSAFGVANAGHAHVRVVEAVTRQAGQLLHGMGDVHPPAVKVEFLEALARLFPGGGPAKTVLGTSGSDAVEIALKTAQIATGRAGVLAFEGAYHGLTLGALATTWRPLFREPFASRLPDDTRFARFGDLADVDRIAAESGDTIGAILVEPVQGRAGERIPPDGFLEGLRERCDRHGWLLIADEVYTGFGRTGRWFACEHAGVVPDLLCVGKGLASGMPLSACMGKASVMDAWPASPGEAIHTQTFLGHPPGCAAALASIRALEREHAAQRAAETGKGALAHLAARTAGVPGVREVRGLGLLLGIELESPEQALSGVERALRSGVITLPSGDDGRVIALSPPLGIDANALHDALDIVVAALG